MFDLHKFVMDGLISAIGNWADYKVIFNALGWQEKGVLTDEDMAVIQTKIDEKNTPPEPLADPLDPVVEAVCKE